MAEMADKEPRGPRRFITPDQRRDFGCWSAALGQIDDVTKVAEAEAWIASAMAILDRSDVCPAEEANNKEVS